MPNNETNTVPVTTNIVSNMTKSITFAWVFITTVYFIGSFAYPYIEQKNLNFAKNMGQQEGYNLAVQDAMKTFSGNIFQNGQIAGSKETVLQLVNMLGKQIEGGCQEAVPVQIPNSTGSVGILSVPCYQMIQQAAQSGQVAPQQQAPEPARK